MKQSLMVVALILASKMGLAAPLQLHNRIVFTRGSANPAYDETVWTMNGEGSGQKRVWGVPKGYGRFGGFSRNGKLALSFNNFNLYLHDLQNKRIRRVLLWSSGWGTQISFPSFSPDGKQILCEVGNYNGSVYRRVLRLQAGKSYSVVKGLREPMVILKGQDVPADHEWGTPSWSADGKHIAVVGGLTYSASPPSTLCQTDIWMLNPDGTGARRLTHDDAWELESSWSPDGSKIAFVRRTDVSDGGDGFLYFYNLWIVDARKRSEKPLTFYPLTADQILAHNATGTSTVVSTPRFSPDGTRIAFQEDKELGQRDSGIFRVDADGTNQKRLGDGRLMQWIW